MESSTVITVATTAAAVGQVVAAIAVIITIVLVSRQLRLSARELRTSSFHGDVANAIALNSLFIADAEFTELYLRAQRDPGSLSRIDALRWHLYLIAVFRHYDSLYSQFRAGTLDRELWIEWEHTFATWLQDHNWLPWFDNNAQKFSSSLGALVQRLRGSHSNSRP